MLNKNIRNPVLGPMLAVAVAMLFMGTALAQVPPIPSVPDVDVPFTPLVTAYAEDFELDDGDYTAGGTATWEWGSATNPPDTMPGQGPSMWGTQLNGDYGANECGWTQSPPIDLTDPPAVSTDSSASLARLAFKHWMHAEMSSFSGNAWDGGVLMASTNGTEFQLIEPVGGYPSSGAFSTLRGCLGVESDQPVYTSPASPAPAADAWEVAEFDITDYLGGDLHLRWVFGSDGSTHSRGWYVDDVIVQVGTGASITSPQIEDLDLPTVQVPFSPIATVYAQDFELDNGGYGTSGTPTFEWGQPASPPETLPGQGPGLWGTRLGGDYEPDECGFLTSSAIDLSDFPEAPAGESTLAQLSFKHWIHAEMSSFSGNAWDGGIVLVSSNGVDFRIVEPVGGYTSEGAFSAMRSCFDITSSQPVYSTTNSPEPAMDAWETAAFDVTDFLGGDLHIRWGFASDGSVENAGWYIDDVAIQVGLGTEELGADTTTCAEAPSWSSGGVSSSWCYGVPSTGPPSSKAVWATNLDGDHNERECSWIMSEPIDTNSIPGLGQLRLGFEHYMRTTSTVSGGVIQVSTDDGLTWTTVTPINGYPESLSTTPRGCIDPTASSLRGFARDATGSSYDYREVNLASYLGDTIRVRYIFGSGTSTDDGWYIRSAALNRGLANVPIMPMSGSDPIADFEKLIEKAGPDLKASVLAGKTTGFEVIVTGQAHEGVDLDKFPDRQDAMTELEGRAAPFFEHARELADLSGGKVVATWSAAPALKLQGDLDLLMAIARLDVTTHLAEDAHGKVRLIDPIEDDGAGVMNTEGRQMLQAEEIWAAGFEGDGVTIAVIDTGVDPTHEAFKFANGTSRIAGWADCVSGGCDSSGTPFDDNGHGTHVSGTAAGSSDYDDPTHGVFQETGVAPKATLQGVKFLDGNGGGSFQGAMDALQWSFDNGADLTSNSWGGGCSASAGVITLMNQLTALGMLSVFAAGNSGSGSGTIGGPACGDTALTVGAVDKDFDIASFSSRGPCSDPTTDTGSRTCPDVVAKGVAVRSAIPRSGAGNSDPSGYKTWQGTSMATPHIAGAVVLAEQMKRHFTGSGWDTAAEAEKEVLKLTAIDLGVPGEDNIYGWGHPQLLNILAILDANEDAVILSSFGISNPEVRLGESTHLSFSVRNMGSAVASGQFLATLEHPDGTVETLKDATVALGLLDGESASRTVTVGGNLLPGNYSFRGTFDYTWTNNTTGETESGLVDHMGDFVVKRVFVAMDLNGLDAATTALDPQSLSFTANSTGNDAAFNTRIEFTVPDDYVFLGGGNYDPMDENTRYADPPPDLVVEDKTFGRVTLVWNVGELPVGGSFGFTTNLLPTLPGDYRFLSVAKFQDGAGSSYSQAIADLQTVGLP